MKTHQLRLQHESESNFRFEKLEDRNLLAANLFVDFGDNFPGGTLTTTQGAFRDVANDPVPGDRILGTQLNDSAGGFNAGTILNIIAQTFTTTERAQMMAVVERAYAPLDVNVVELTTGVQTTVDGRNVAGATNMTDVINTLRGGVATWKDAYIFVGTFIVDPGGANQQIYTGGGGLSPGGGLDTPDISSASNLHDDVAVVYSSGGLTNNTLNNTSHEAGHLFGLRHAITNRTGTTATNLFHQAEIMSYRNTNNTTSSMFTRYPMIRGDGNSPQYSDTATFNAAARTITRPAGSADFDASGFVVGLSIVVSGTTSNDGTYVIQSVTPSTITLTAAATLTNEMTASTIRSLNTVNYNDISARNGEVTIHDQLRMDANVLANANFTFVTGTGAHDIITITKNGATADVTVRAFADAAYTSVIIVPGEADGTYSYSIPLNLPILVYAGDSNDRIVVDGDLGVDVQIDGMLGDDTLVVKGKGAATATYRPNATATAGVDLVDDFGGTVTIGANSINFNNFETAGSARIENVTTVTYSTPAAGVDDLTLNSSSGTPGITGTVNNGTGAVPLLLQTVNRLVVETGSGTDMLTLEIVTPFAGGMSFDGGANDDTLDDNTGTSNLFTIDGADSGNLDSSLDFSSVENLIGDSNTDTFQFNGGALSGTIDGTSGIDTFDFTNETSQTIDLANADADGFDGTVAGGNLVANGFTDIDTISGSTAGLTDTLNGLNVEATWVINNSAGSYTVNPTLDLLNFETFNGGSAVDTFNVLATNTTTNLNGNGDDDVFTLSSNAPNMTGNVSGITGVVNVDGGSDNNQLIVSDFSGSGNINVVITNNAITGIAPATITYTASGNFTVPGQFNGVWVKGSDANTDNIQVESFLAGNTLRIDANGSNDRIKTHANALGDMQLDGGDGSDAVHVQFINDMRRVNAHDTGSGDNDVLKVTGLVSADSIVVRATSIARNIVDRVWHDANTENLQVMSIGGDDVLNFAASDADNVTVQTGVGEDFIDVINTGNASTLEILMSRGSDVAIVEMTNANTSTIVNTQHDQDFVFVGSTLTKDYGSLDRIQGPLSLFGGNNATGVDQLYINDRATASGQIYRIDDMQVSSLSPRTFTSLWHTEFEFLRLDGTDFADEFEVTPSALTRFLIGGNLPTPHDINCAAEGDFLNLVADASSGRLLTLTDRANGEGFWSFSNGFQRVDFTSIERFNHVERLAIGSDAFLGSVIRVLDAETRDTLFDIFPFESTFTGGVRVATGDVSGDGIPDIIAGAGAGRIPEVRIFDGVDGQLIDSFIAYDTFLWDGILLTAGDVSGNCGVDIVTTTGPGSGKAEVRVWENNGSGFQMVDHFLPFGANYFGGADVAVADFSGDGNNDIAVGALHGLGHVAVFDGTVAGGAAELASFMAFGSDFFGGVHVTVGNVIGSDRADLIVSTGHNSWHSQYDSKVHIYNGDNLAYTPGVYDAPDAQFYAFYQKQNSESSTRVAVKDHDLDGVIDELFASHGPGDNTGLINVFEPLNSNVVDTIFETSQPFEHGIFVG